MSAREWTPADLAPILDGLRTGTISGPVPSLMTRTDGVSLLYPGQIHSFSGEPETGKGWIVQAESARVLKLGKKALYLDFETTAVEVLERLLALGTTEQEIVAGFVYVRPDVAPDGDTLTELLARGPFELAMIDGVSEAYVLLGLDPDDNADAARFIAALPQRIADAGAAVVDLDHVVKASESRGRYAIGAQHKLAGIACAFTVEAITRPARTTPGTLKLKVQKDRHGHVRSHATGDTIALVTVTPSDEGRNVAVTVDPPEGAAADGTVRPTVLMVKISRFLDDNPGATTSDIRSSGGNADWLKKGLDILIAEGYVEMKPDGPAHRHYNRKPFTETNAKTNHQDHQDQPKTRPRPATSQDQDHQDQPPTGGLVLGLGQNGNGHPAKPTICDCPTGPMYASDDDGEPCCIRCGCAAGAGVIA